MTTLAEFRAAAERGFADDPNGEIFAALERARVVGVLDAHVEARGDRCGETWQCEQFSELPEKRWKVYVTGNGGSIFYGATPDAARAAAAKAIEAGEV